MRYAWLVLVALLFALAPATAAAAVAAPGDPVPVESQVQQLQQQVAELQAEVTKLQAEKEHYQYLSEETKGFREFVQQERAGLQMFMEWFLGIGAVVIAGLAGFFG